MAGRPWAAEAERDMKLRAEGVVAAYGRDILASAGMQAEKNFIQHGTVSVFAHSVGVACLCVTIAAAVHLRVNQRSLVRGALLHDYFLYDWHTRDREHALHGFTHAGRALRNAERDFILNPTERNMIAAHMFPLGTTLPRCRESAVLWVADKICAARETVRRKRRMPRRNGSQTKP